MPSKSVRPHDTLAMGRATAQEESGSGSSWAEPVCTRDRLLGLRPLKAWLHPALLSSLHSSLGGLSHPGTSWLRPGTSGSPSATTLTAGLMSAPQPWPTTPAGAGRTGLQATLHPGARSAFLRHTSECPAAGPCSLHIQSTKGPHTPPTSVHCVLVTCPRDNAHTCTTGAPDGGRRRRTLLTRLPSAPGHRGGHRTWHADLSWGGTRIGSRGSGHLGPPEAKTVTWPHLLFLRQRLLSRNGGPGRPKDRPSRGSEAVSRTARREAAGRNRQQPGGFQELGEGTAARYGGVPFGEGVQKKPPRTFRSQ